MLTEYSFSENNEAKAHSLWRVRTFSLAGQNKIHSWDVWPLTSSRPMPVNYSIFSPIQLWIKTALTLWTRNWTSSLAEIHHPSPQNSLLAYSEVLKFTGIFPTRYLLHSFCPSKLGVCRHSYRLVGTFSQDHRTFLISKSAIAHKVWKPIHPCFI